jgi:DNA-binding CsgD family transcriptional regulator
MDRSRNRSDKYQDTIRQTPASFDMLSRYSETQGLYGKFNNSEYNEEILDLQDQLTAARWRLIKTHLTPRQKEVLELTAQGKTQTEIADELGVNQSSITKSIYGNCDYKKTKKTIYGGAKKKLKKLESEDEEIQSIIKKIAEIQSAQMF